MPSFDGFYPSRYMDGRKENSWVSDGTLKIIARREDWLGEPFTSARIRTRGKGGWMRGAVCFV